MLISELPKEYQDIFPKKENRRNSDTDDINDAITWRKHFPGAEFWGACYRAQSKDELPQIPPPPKEGFNIVETGKVNKVEFIKDGIKHGRLVFSIESMSNCGITLFKNFGFPTLDLFKEYKKEILKFYLDRSQGYPYVLATHNEHYKEYFEGWEEIHEFLNPNSNNYVQMWKLTRKDHK